MSEQKDGFLKMGSSYNFDREKINNYANNTISSNAFHQWTKNNMYKSSYSHYHSKNSVQPKNTAIPGYLGYIPSIKAQNIHAKGFSAMAKQSFHNQRLDKNIYGMATTGFNLNRDTLIDRSKVASSSKYGKTELQRAHPGWNADWRSTTQQTFKNPKTLLDPTYRPTQKFLQTVKPQTRKSGFSTNRAYLDGTGWKPHPILNGDNNRSQYRDRLNADHPFHRITQVSVKPQLLKKELNYKYN